MNLTRAQRAQLALALEVCATPTPGNVDRHREYPDLRFEHFLAGAIGAHDGLELAAEHGPDATGIGRAFEHAVEGMSQQEGGNTQFGALLLLVPLVRSAAKGSLSPDGATAVINTTTSGDAAEFYRAFDHVNVSVKSPPENLEDLDVRLGADAIPAVKERGLTLKAVMKHAVDRDGIAREWINGFERTFEAADRIENKGGTVPDRTAKTFLELLAAEPDPFVAIQHDEATAQETSERAAAALAGEIDPSTLGESFVSEGINPGTTADLIAGGLYVALEGGVSV